MKILHDIIVETLKQYRRANIGDANTRERIAETVIGVYTATKPEVIREKKVPPRAFPPGA